jgi:hypothetical protein
MTQQLLIHFDSIFGQKANDPFLTTFNIPPLENVSSIYLKSIEIPIAFDNVRNSGTLNQFSITLNSVVYSITLTSNNYTSIAQLCTDITTAFSLLSLPSSSVVTVSVVSKNVTVSIVSGSAITFTVNDTQLAYYVLGFIKQSSQVNQTINALNRFNLNVDNYLNFSFSNLSVRNSNANSTVSSYKIPLNGVNGEIIYFQENVSFKQRIDLSLPNIVNSLKVSINDRFGNVLINNGNDYSFSLGFEIKNNFPTHNI